MGSGSESDSDAPEELTAEQGVMQDEEIRRVQRENKIRLAQEAKERRRHRAQRTARPESDKKGIPVQEPEQLEEHDIAAVQEEHDIPGMLPSNIVNLLAAQEKKTFSSDSEEEVIDRKPTSKKKKQKITGPETVLLKDIPHAQCLQNSLEFLKRRKMQVPRSNSSLKNANKALRLLSTRGNL